MKEALKTGFSFGITSGVLTTLGLMIGLSESTGSKVAVLGGILTIAFADSLSDSLGIHISEESEGKTSQNVWISTFATFLSKLVFALTFAIPVLAFDLNLAVLISVLWGTFLISAFSYNLAITNKKEPIRVIAEHLIVMALVVIGTYYLGSLINSNFK